MNAVAKIVVVFASTFAAAAVGVIFLDAHVASWYGALAKPPFTPPAILFALVWLILYVLMALACCIVWLKKQNAHTEGWVRFYFVQLLLNAAWTVFFFGFHAMTLAFLDVLFLGFMVLGLTASAGDIDMRVRRLMWPYFLWLVFAAYLAAGIWLLN